MTSFIKIWTLGDLAQTGGSACPIGDIVQHLVSSGFDPEPAKEIQAMFQSSAQRLLSNAEAANPTTPCRAFWVPGRIEVLGKHTDYAGGKSLLGAVNKGFAVVSTTTQDAVQNNVRIFTQFSDGRELNETLRLIGTPEDLERLRKCTTDEGGWAAYPAAAVQRLTSNFGITVGADIAIECSLPEASGMSSSSAVICYMWMVLDSYNDISSGINGKATNAAAFAKSIAVNTDMSPGTEGEANLYTFLGNIENGKDFRPGQGEFTLNGMGGVGTFGGSEDHTAIMSCTKGQLKMWEYCPTKHLRTVNVDPNVRFVVAVSGAKAEKTGAAMNEYNDACALAAWSAACFTVSRASSTEKPMDRDTLGALFPNTTLYNPNVPNCAEVVRQVRAELNNLHSNYFGDRCGTKRSSDDSSSEQVRSTIIAAMRSVTSHFKTSLPAVMGPLGLGCDGLESDRITMDVLVQRFEQYFDESEDIVSSCCEHFDSKNYEALGTMVDSSHLFTVEKLKNTIPETAWLPRWARTAEGKALAASAFGAGFGGSCWALVNKDESEDFCKRWLNAYEKQFPAKEGCGLTREFFVFAPGPGAFAL